jgi:hypothetical protein
MRQGANSVSIYSALRQEMPVSTFGQRWIEGNFSEKSILQFNNLPGDRLSDLQNADRINREKTVAGGRTGVETEDAFV